MKHACILSLSLFALGLSLASCKRTATPPEGPLTIQVLFNEAAGDDLGLDEPLPFSHDATTFTVDIEVIDRDGSVMEDFEGDCRLRTRPGDVMEPLTVDLSGGRVEGLEVSIKGAFGPTRIWVVDSERDEASWATGVTPEIRFADPTLAETQIPTGGDVSPLLGNHVNVRADDRNLIVTHISSDGMYVTDTIDPPGSYGSMFVFNFNRPKGVEEGDRLKELDGNIQEYLSFTELSHPSFLVDSSGHEIPEPSLLTATEICGGDDILEGHESALVRVENVITRFVDAEDCDDYVNYGQWPMELATEDCDGVPAELNVVNAYTVPDLRFNSCDEGILPDEREFAYLQGTLRHNYAAEPAWILEIRGCSDLPEEDRPEDCEDISERAKGHYSGPAPVPRQYTRAIPWCEGVPYELD